MAEKRGPSRMEKLREAMGQPAPEKERSDALRAAGERFMRAQQAYSRAESDLKERAAGAIAAGVSVAQVARDAGVAPVVIDDLLAQTGADG